MTDPTRTIGYIESEEEALNREVELAFNSTMEENLIRYCQVLSAQLAMQGIDLKTHPVERTIYFIEEEQ
ncbi:MAG: hypothetical protein R8G66_19315 [Cytophagales bacterium]|nr:hypothetical protein [Cytophagales bacterium]